MLPGFAMTSPHLGMNERDRSFARDARFLVPAEIAGIRLPDLEVPVGTHTGWNLRAPESGAPEQMISMMGLSNLFAPTRALREAKGDFRPSIEERYKDRPAYLARVQEAAEALAGEGYILGEDVEIVVSACAERYDTAMAGE